MTTSGAEDAARTLMTALEMAERALAKAVTAGEEIARSGPISQRQDAGSADERIAELERQLADERARFEYLIDQQDKFVGSLIEDHEQALAEAALERDAVLAQLRQLQNQLAQPNTPKTQPSLLMPPKEPSVEQLRAELLAAQATIDKMTTERERSLDMLRRVHAQRDASQRELAQLRRKQFSTETPTVAPPPAESAERTREALRAQDRRPTDPAPPPPSVEPPHASVEPLRRSPLVLSDLDAAWDRETYPAPPPPMDPSEPAEPPPSVEPPVSSNPRGMGATLRHSPPPLELSAAVLGMPPSSDRRDSSQPVRSKPALHQRPLIGYSVRPNETEPELLEDVRRSSPKPPR